MGCCALGTCTDPGCYLCTVVAKLPQPERARNEQKDANPARDGDPALAAERKRKKKASA
jgi:hypothetical protein